MGNAITELFEFTKGVSKARLFAYSLILFILNNIFGTINKMSPSDIS